jgi:hypothetical protein
MSTRVATGLVLVATLLIGVAAMPSPVLLVTSASGAIDICLPLGTSEPVILTFTNSMYGGEVREQFEIANGHLVRTRFVTENAASAEYYAWNAAIEVMDDGYEVKVPPESFAFVPVLVDTIGDYRLVAGDEEILLSDMVTEPDSTKISIKTMPLIGRLFGGC